MWCPNCGYKNEDGSAFCAKCGARLDQELTGIDEEETKVINDDDFDFNNFINEEKIREEERRKEEERLREEQRLQYERRKLSGWRILPVQVLSGFILNFKGLSITKQALTAKIKVGVNNMIGTTKRIIRR